MKTSVEIDESGYSTLKYFLISCQVSIPEKALTSFLTYKGSFPTTFKEIIGEDFDLIVDMIPDIVFVNLQNFAKHHSFPAITDEAVCLFFGSREHLETAKHSPITERGLTYDQWIVGHLTWPACVVYKEKELITAKGIDKEGNINEEQPVFKKVIDLSGKAELGVIILVHFGTVVLVNPSKGLLNQLFNLRKDFHGEIPKITEIDYSLALKDTLKRIKRYLDR